MPNECNHPCPIVVARTIARSSLTANPRYVAIDEAAIEPIADQMRTLQRNRTALVPAWMKMHSAIGQASVLILYELMANAVNYKYWYAHGNCRPGGANAIMMYKLLDAACEGCRCGDTPTAATDGTRWELASETFAQSMMFHRFPLAAERASHLREVAASWSQFVPELAAAVASGETGLIDFFMQRLLCLFPGYAQDIFLKRASLFFMQLHRRMGWFADDISILPVPADYQVPKVLRQMGILKYGPELTRRIRDRELIPSGSLMEAEIRASTIVAGDRLAALSGRSTSDVDFDLWAMRDAYPPDRQSVTDGFHLTNTTDY